MKKKILSAILSFAMVFSVVASVSSVSASSAIADDVVWEQVFEELMQEYPDKYDSGEGSVEKYFDIDGYPASSSWITNGFSKFENESKSSHALKIYSKSNKTMYAALKVEESPLYKNPSDKLRIEFDFGTDYSKEGFYIILVGEKDGKIVQTTAGDSNRFIFTSANCLNFEDSIKSINKNTWYNMKLDFDCTTQKYDVYLDDVLVTGEKDVFPAKMDKIYGVSFASRSKSGSEITIYIDNLRYYTPKASSSLAESKVTLNTNGGSINSGNITSYTEGVGATLPTDVTKPDYKFSGWYENPSFEGSAVTEISKTATGDKTYYAKWEKLVLIKDGVEWKKIFEELMTEEPINSGEGPIAQYYDLGDAYPNDSTWISGDPGRGFTNYSEKYGFTDQAVRLGGDAILNLEKSPLYTNPNNSLKIRIEFGLATNHKDAKAYIDLVGDVDGKTVTTTHNSSERFVFVEENQLFYDNGENSIEGRTIVENTCYKITIDIDCEAGIYDVYVNDEPSAAGIALPYSYDAIYGVGFSRTSNVIYVDDIRYYTIKTVGTGVFSDITLNTNGGSINSGNITSYEEGVGAVLPADVTKDGHKFDGWYENSDFTGNPVKSINAKASGDKIYYAKWLAVYSVTLNTNGGTINSGSVTSYIEGTATDLPVAVTKPNVYFAGWYENPDFSGSAVKTIPADATGNKTYYAKYAQWPVVGEAPIILLKFDDLNSASAVERFELAFDIVKEKGVKCGMGVICSNLEDGQEDVSQEDIDALADAVMKFHSEGVEIWSHGYRHTAAEYGSDSYEQQKESFGKALAVMKEKCGIDITSFGAPENKSTTETVRMINENYPQIKTLMLVKDPEHIAIPEVVTVRANIEKSTGVFDFENFKKQYARVKTAKAIVLQGHPHQWNDNERKQLEQTIDYLKAEGAIFMTPTEYARYCEATEDKEQWRKVWHLDFETENVWKNYFESTQPDVMGDYNTDFTDTTNESQGAVAMNAGSIGGIQSLNLIADKSPLYNDENNGKVRIEFDFLKVNTTEDFWINLVGKVDGEVKQTSRNYAERFIFMNKDKIYFDNDSARLEGPAYLEKIWYKITVDIDCKNRLYDVYINDKLQCENNRLAFAFDEIYGVSFTADNSGEIEMNKPLIDNIRYYTALETGDEVYFMDDSTEKTVLVYSAETHSDLTLCVAAYKGGKMTDVIVKENVELVNGINSFPVEHQWGWDDRDTVRVFLWDDKLVPNAKAKTFEFNR